MPFIVLSENVLQGHCLSLGWLKWLTCFPQTFQDIFHNLRDYYVSKKKIQPNIVTARHKTNESVVGYNFTVLSGMDGMG